MSVRPASFAALAATVLVLPGRPARPGAAPTVARYKIAQQTEQEVDLSAMGGGKQASRFGTALYVTLTVGDTTGGRTLHVVFDSMDAYLPAAALRVQAAVVNVVCGGMLLLLAVLMWKTGNDFLASGETTAQLKILKAPFIWGMSVLCGITALLHFALVAAPPKQLAEGEGAAL